MLELRHVAKHFSAIPAVDDVSFSARPGEVTGYLGPNGSGKSTTMKMITGLIEITLGHIYVVLHDDGYFGETCALPPGSTWKSLSSNVDSRLSATAAS